MSFLIAGGDEIVRKSFRKGNAIANWKQNVEAMRKTLDVKRR